MTSAPNLRQPLSGNNSQRFSWVALCLLFTFTLASCELFKPLPQPGERDEDKEEELDAIQGQRVYDPVTGTYVLVRNAPTDPMDTIIWKDIPSSIEPPIYSTSAPVAGGPGGGANPVKPIGLGEGNSELLSSYNVAVLLPFLSDRYNSIDKRIAQNSTWALQFYNGMEMAFDELSDAGIALNVTVMDSKANPTHVTNLARTNRALNDAHLIIGPYLRNNATLLADKARSTGAILVSPHSASSNVSMNNPNYVQVKPTLESHCRAIMRHALQNASRDQIVLVGMDTEAEAARFGFFQDEYEIINNLTDTEPLKQLLVDTTKLDMQHINLKEWMGVNDETIFILPTWSKESFVYSFLAKLDLDRESYQRVRVYGMPQWMDYERIDFDYYEKLNVHVSSSVFLDDLNADIRAFKRRYYERFSEIPSEEAFLGYDVARYFGNAITDFGTKFPQSLDQRQNPLLHTTFRFQPIVSVNTTTGVELPQVQRWENTFVNILKFQNYRFMRAE